MTTDANVFSIPSSTRFRRHAHEGAHLCVVLDGGFLERDRSSWRDVGPGTIHLWRGAARHRRRGVVNASPSNNYFWRAVFAGADTLPVKRFVLDLRENGGGNSFSNRQVIRGIVARPRIDERGHLFAIISPQTFSPAMNLALDLQQWTNVTFVGAPTGNATTFFGDHEQLQLPRSRITVNVLTLPWYPDDPRDKRDFLAPALYTPKSSTADCSNIDPAMAAILSAPNVVLRDQLSAAAARGDFLPASGGPDRTQ